MKKVKQYIIIIILFIITSIITFIQIFNIQLTDGITGLPHGLSINEVLKNQTIYTLYINTGVFILSSFIIFFLNYIFKKKKYSLNTKLQVSITIIIFLCMLIGALYVYYIL